MLAVLGNGLSGQALRVVGGSGPQYFTAAVQVPSGALLKSVRYDVCDASGGSGALVTGALVVTDALGNVQTTSPTVDSAGTGCQSLTTDLTGLALTVDNNAKHYSVVVSLTNAGAPLVGLAGVTVAYQLQVSPAPGAATFGDVPTNSSLLPVRRGPGRVRDHGRLRQRQLLPGHRRHARTDGGLSRQGSRPAVPVRRRRG